MPDYSLGKIYKIVGNGKVYVGSTTRPLLCQRFSQHRSHFKYWKKGKNCDYLTSFECLEDPTCYIELLESCPCTSKDELHRCETKWMKQIQCVNKHVATGFNRKEYYQEYYQQNKEKYQKKLLAINNGIAILERNLSVKSEAEPFHAVIPDHQEGTHGLIV